MKRSILMEYGTLVPSGNRLAEKTLATLYDPFNEELKCPSVSYPAIMAFVLYIEKHGITRGLKNNSSNETALYFIMFLLCFLLFVLIIDNLGRPINNRKIL